jgi:hypothetical protein
MLAAVVGMAMMILLALVMLLRKSWKVTAIGAAEDEGEEGAPPAAGSEVDYARIAGAFRQAKSSLRFLGEGDRYKTPLVLLMGAEGSRDPGFLKKTEGSGLEFHRDPMKEGLTLADGREFLFFDRGGVVLDVAGEPVLGSGGKHADDGSWRRIMSSLVEMRPKRPVDSIVLTVSGLELRDAVGNDTLRLALEDAARRVRDRLWDLQEKSGFRLPLYVLVTNCEVLDGFGETAAALAAPAFRGQILGWSSPYGVQVPYQSKWIDEAFGTVGDALRDLQMELFRAESQSEKVMLFPWSIGSIAEPLRTFLDQLLSPGARHEGTMTRGIYFCGKVEDRTAFAADLFAKKIFREAALAVPTSAMRMTRSRKARRLHIATAALALLMFAGLGFGFYQLEKRKNEVRPLLTEAEGDQRGIASMTLTGNPLNDAAKKILTDVAKIGFDKFGPVWLPATWFSRFDDDLDKAIARSFETIVLKAIYQDLDERAKAKILEATGHVGVSRVPSPAPAPDASVAEAVEPVENMPEFIRLKTFVNDLRDIEEQGKRFNRVVTFGDGDVESLGELVNYSFAGSLPEAFLEHNTAFRRAVKDFSLKSRFHPKEMYSKDASAAAKEQVDALYARLFDENLSQKRVDALAAAFDPESFRRLGAGAVDAANLRKLDSTIHSLQSDLSSPALEWAFRPTFNLGPQFNEVLSTMDRSEMFGPNPSKAYREDGTNKLLALQKRLAEPARLGFPILKLRAPSAPLMALSHETEVLHTALESFLGQPFAASEASQASQSLDARQAGACRPMPNERLEWDMAQLDESASIYHAYTEFRKSGLALFPPSFADTIDRTARQHTATQMAIHLAQAQRCKAIPPAVTSADREENVQLAAAMFESAAKAIHPQLDALQWLNATIPRNQIIRAQSTEAIRLLRSAEGLLQANGPFLPQTANFDWWDGKNAPAFTAWGTHDEGELAEYLDTTQARVKSVSDSYAAPALKWFDDFPNQLNPGPSKTGDAALVAQWQSISNDLRNFAAKKPANPPALLHDYIAIRAAKVTIGDCRVAELTAAEKETHGFFAEQLKTIAERLGARCRLVAAYSAASRYDELARLFNQRLAGRYPFSEQAPKPGDVEADPDDVRLFFARFDESKRLFAGVPDEAARGWFKPGRKFFDDMARVRLFFAPFLDAQKPVRLPEVNVEMQFRVMKEHEAGANEIIDWTLTIGNEKATSFTKSKKLPWRPGMPVRLDLRWAKNAPREPVLQSAQRNVSIEDGTVVYRYSNRWSLLTALADLRASSDDLPDSIDREPVTLAVNVLTKPVAGGDADPRHPTILFLRWSLSGSDGQPLDLPKFPSTAPPLLRMTAEAMP